uniref:Presenilin-A n=1 Tax=Lygus hesperus TaxID=30085 RepID=A0A0A9X7R8_LYGHE
MKLNKMKEVLLRGKATTRIAKNKIDETYNEGEEGHTMVFTSYIDANNNNSSSAFPFTPPPPLPGLPNPFAPDNQASGESTDTDQMGKNSDNRGSNDDVKANAGVSLESERSTSNT